MNLICYSFSEIYIAIKDLVQPISHVKDCDPTEVNEADVVRGPIAICCQKYFTGINLTQKSF